MINFLMLFFLSFQLVPGQQPELEWVGGWPFGPCYFCATDTLRDLCFLQSGGGVYILDINDPSNPAIISERIKTEGRYRNITYNYDQQMLFIQKMTFPNDSTFEYRTETWDVSSIYNPAFVSEYNFGNYHYQYILKDTLAYIPVNKYVPPYQQGYKIYNIANPNNIQLIYYDTTREVNYLCLMDSLLILSSDSIYIINNSDPLNPILISSIPSSILGWFYWCGIKNEYLFSMNPNMLFVFDISDPQNPQLIDSLTNSVFPYSAIIHRDKIYISSMDKLGIVDISDPYNCNYIGIFPIQIMCLASHQIAAYKDNILLPIEMNLLTIDIDNPSNPQITSEFQVNLENYDFEIIDDYLLLIDLNQYLNNQSQLRVIDIFDYINCHQISSCTLISSPYSIETKDNYSFIGEYHDSTMSFLEIIDISNPLHPNIVNTCTLPPNYGEYSHINGDLLYISPDYLYDISNPVNPTFISQLPLQGWDLRIKNNFGYLNKRNSINIIDLSNPYYPFVVTSIGGNEFATIDLVGEYIYAQDMNDIKVIDISDPYNPWVVNSCFLPSAIIYADVNLDGNDDYAAVTTAVPSPYTDYRSGKVYLVNTSDLNNLNIEQEKTIPRWGTNLEIVGEDIFVSSLVHGFDIYHYPPLVSVTESPPILSPLNLNSTFFSSSRPLLSLSGLPSQGTINIYSVDGRKVFDQEFSQSEFHLNLNNLDISSGVYFLKVTDQEGDDLLMKKLELLR
ncbi:MAG: T9SS type A sorting domain-containing protein [bacterium]